MSWRAKVESEGRNTVPDVWRDGCAALSRNACDLLGAARLPVTKESLLVLLDGMSGHAWPTDSACGRCLTQVYADADAGWVPVERAVALSEYFVSYLGEMRNSTRKMLEESFHGFLEGLSLDSDLPLATEIAEEGPC